MIDLLGLFYLFNVILNICSTIFTLLFLLYRFTSLFTYIYGFIRFCGKLIKSCFYVKNKIQSFRSGYIYTSLSQNDSQSNTFKNVAYKKIKSVYNYFFPKKKEYNILPIYQTRESFIESQNDYNNNNNNNNNYDDSNSNYDNLQDNHIHSNINIVQYNDTSLYNKVDNDTSLYNNGNNGTSLYNNGNNGTSLYNNGNNGNNYNTHQRYKDENEYINNYINNLIDESSDNSDDIEENIPLLCVNSVTDLSLKHKNNNLSYDNNTNVSNVTNVTNSKVDENLLFDSDYINKYIASSKKNNLINIIDNERIVEENVDDNSNLILEFNRLSLS